MHDSNTEFIALEEIELTDIPDIASVLTPETNFHDEQKEVEAENKIPWSHSKKYYLVFIED